MPIYEYHCTQCGRNFELLVRGDTSITCPSCQSRKAERMMSLPALPGAGGKPADFSRLGPPANGGCCGGGGCGCH
jgi:putative FmdB family regulatory protein